MIHSIWVEKYRPARLCDVIFQNSAQAEQFARLVAGGTIPNLLFYGTQGTGKTTLSKVLISELSVDPADRLRINCSDEKIEAMREKVKTFSQSLPLGNFKVVQLEELDYLSLDAQALLRQLMEETAQYTRFIGTCNYVNKVIPALRSRFQEFEFKAPDMELVASRMAQILESEGVSYEPEVLLELIQRAYPDIRKIIQLLQQNSGGGTLARPSTGGAVDWKLELVNCLSRSDWWAARKVVCAAPKEEHEEVYRFLYDNVDKLKVKNKEQAVVTIAEYLYRHSLVADTEINLAALFIELSKV